MIKSSSRNILIITGIILIPALLFCIWYFNRPFEKTLLEQQAAVGILSPIQRHNVQLAIQRLNGTILEPQKEFSFNKIIGPRNSRRGYLAAPSYLADGSPKTLGGGICLLSSSLYWLALRAGLHIEERHPHLRPIKTVPPGFDAAVWYGQSDLRFTNNTDQPLQIKALMNQQRIVIKLKGKKSITENKLVRQIQQKPRGLFVSLNRTKKINSAIKTELISDDQYQK